MCHENLLTFLQVDFHSRLLSLEEKKTETSPSVVIDRVDERCPQNTFKSPIFVAPEVPCSWGTLPWFSQHGFVPPLSHSVFFIHLQLIVLVEAAEGLELPTLTKRVPPEALGSGLLQGGGRGIRAFFPTTLGALLRRITGINSGF